MSLLLHSAAACNTFFNSVEISKWGEKNNKNNWLKVFICNVSDLSKELVCVLDVLIEEAVI